MEIRTKTKRQAIFSELFAVLLNEFKNFSTNTQEIYGFLRLKSNNSVHKTTNFIKIHFRDVKLVLISKFTYFELGHSCNLASLLLDFNSKSVTLVTNCQSNNRKRIRRRKYCVLYGNKPHLWSIWVAQPPYHVSDQY